MLGEKRSEINKSIIILLNKIIINIGKSILKIGNIALEGIYKF